MKKFNKPLLCLGILFLPYIFAWFTLREGYSKKLRVFAFGWLTFFVAGLCISLFVPQQKTITEQESVVTKTKQTIASSTFDNCTYAEKILRETDDILTTILHFHDDRTSYQEIAQWRVKSFNPQFTELKTKFELEPAVLIHPDNAVAFSMSADYLNRLPILVSDIFSAAKSGDYSKAKEQTQYMRKAIELAKSCLETDS